MTKLSLNWLSYLDRNLKSVIILQHFSAIGICFLIWQSFSCYCCAHPTLVSILCSLELHMKSTYLEVKGCTAGATNVLYEPVRAAFKILGTSV